MTAIGDSTPVKTCTKCGECKPATAEFFPKDGGRLRHTCKKCRAADKARAMAAREAAFPEKREKRMADVRAYSIKNKEKIDRYKREYAKATADQRKKYAREYYLANSDEIKERAKAWKQNNPERRLENNRRWATENPDKSADCSRRNKARRMQDPMLAFVEGVRCLISNSIRNGGYTKRSKTHEILGCDWEFFKRHIERQFIKGMSWSNRRDWHLDHITPLVTASSERDVIQLNHFTNLRPIWAKDNLSKGAQITHLI